ncbi:MAG TPA: hypothetical protein VFZ78_07355 [Flavisolibacter sp.]
MLEDFQEKQQRKVARLRSSMDITMGILIILIGIYFIVYDRLGINVFNREPSSIDYLIGTLFLLYGFWRVYRGYKKDYFK